MYTQKFLRLTCRLETPHTPFSDAGWLMREFRSIVGVLFRAVFHLWDYLPVRNTITAQFVRHDLSRFPTMATQ